MVCGACHKQRRYNAHTTQVLKKMSNVLWAVTMTITRPALSERSQPNHIFDDLKAFEFPLKLVIWLSSYRYSVLAVSQIKVLVLCLTKSGIGATLLPRTSH